MFLVLGNTTQNHDRTVRPVVAVMRITGASNLEEWSMFWITLILFPQTSHFRIKKLCCMCFEDNEAMIKMIFKGRSRTMRHVSRTHRVALDWLFDRINLDPKIQIKYIDTKNQLADMLTKGNFTRILFLLMQVHEGWDPSSRSSGFGY